MAEKIRRRRLKRSRRGANISEFAACLFVFVLFALFPLINLIMFAANCGSVFLITRNAAAAAATSANYSTALTAAQASVTHDLSGGFGKFSKLTPNGGINNSGIDLYIVVTALAGTANTVYGPDTVIPVAPDPSNYIYEYRVTSNFILQPFVNMSSVPFINTVPVVGAAVPFSYNSERSVEDPNGLTSSLPKSPRDNIAEAVMRFFHLDPKKGICISRV